MKEYSYRAAPELINGKDIECKNPRGRTDIIEFIANGSTKIRKTKFISTSKLLGVVVNKHALGKKDLMTNEFIGILKDGEFIKGKRAPIILVDLDAVRKREKEENKDKEDKETYVYDCSTEERMENINIPQEKKQGKKWEKAKINANADREVIITYCIKANEYKQVPPILVDVLDAFEQVNTEDSKLCMQAINDMIMGNPENETSDIEKIMNIINNMQFNEIEKYIITEYYQNMNTMYQIKENFQQFLDEKDKRHIELQGARRDALLEWLTAVKAEITRKIISNKEIQEIIENKKKKIQKENGMIETTTDYEKILKEYYVIPEGIVNGTTSKTQHQFETGDKEKKTLPKYDCFVGRPNILVKVTKDKPINLPIGMKYIKKDGITIGKIIYKILAKGEVYTQHGELRGDKNTSPRIQKDYFDRYTLGDDTLQISSKFLTFFYKMKNSEGKEGLKDNMQDARTTETSYKNAKKNVENEQNPSNNKNKGISNENIGEN